MSDNGLLAYVTAEGQKLDGAGVCGSLLHYMLTICLVGTAFLVFLYLWRKGKLDMDEEPKNAMMQHDEQVSRKEKHDKK